ncbi:lytic transglycosylase domain-containing protein [Clostridium ganghwense]|uniref:Lytic transglycosylase domain-containing protein n=1 Tax=Clostridium ganghwense TaxID=312089 RepID=A0ABT4CNX6_9CLOT|nr:lytic transglycosylase domain-containing protein [Clostridium ganghwense]MCY6370761.1 lytic transglycosylase domain-containing protein [Clostridium ganghwense]
MKVKKRIRGLVFIIILIMIVLNVKAIGRKIYPIKYNDYIKKYSVKYDFNPYVVAAVIKVESNYNKNARSKKDAIGLMQMTPSTAKEVADKMKIEDFTVDMLYDPELNINMGCWYLNDLRREFGENMELILAAYNGGRGNVKKWLKDKGVSKDGENLHYIPFKETDKYVKKVKVNYNVYNYLYGDEYKKQ